MGCATSAKLECDGQVSLHACRHRKQMPYCCLPVHASSVCERGSADLPLPPQPLTFTAVNVASYSLLHALPSKQALSASTFNKHYAAASPTC